MQMSAWGFPGREIYHTHHILRHIFNLIAYIVLIFIIINKYIATNDNYFFK